MINPKYFDEKLQKNSPNTKIPTVIENNQATEKLPLNYRDNKNYEPNNIVL